MATITPTDLTLNAISADLLVPSEGSTEATVGAHSIDEVQPSDRLIISLFEDGGGAATIVFSEGANPPAVRASLGDLASITIPTNDCVLIVIEASRFMQADDTIDFTIGGQSVDVGVFRIPRTG